MICTTCFAESAESAAVCANCGRALPQVVPEREEIAEAAAAQMPGEPVSRLSEAPPFRDPRRLKTWLVGSLICFGVVMLVSVGLDIAQIRLIDAINAGSFTSQVELMEEAEANDSRQQAIGVLYVIFFVATLVIFGMWIYRVAKNARAISAEQFDTSPGMAVGSYFIPIINLWIPYRAMSEIWRASRNPVGWRNDRAGAFLGWWWAIWLCANIVANFTVSEPQGLAEIRRASQMSILAVACGLASVVMALLLVTHLTAYQMQASTGEALHRIFE